LPEIMKGDDARKGYGGGRSLVRCRKRYRHDGREKWSPDFVADKNTENFLKSWLCGTQGGEEALAAWLKQRGYGRQVSSAN